MEEAVLSRMPMRNLADIAGDYIPVTSSSGDRVYCELDASSTGRQHVCDPRSMQRRSGSRGAGLLQTPIEELMRQVWPQHAKTAILLLMQ